MLPILATPDNIDHPVWVDKATLAKRLDVSSRTISNWMSKGVVPFMRINRVVRFHVKKVEEALSR